MVSLRTRNLKAREFMAEFFGTLTLVCLGCSANAVIKMRSLENSKDYTGNIAGPIAWSLALAGSLYIGAGVSGGHYNPAVTLGLVSTGKFQWKKLIHYFLAQYLGAFIGSLVTFIVYRERLSKFNATETVDIFGSTMRDDITLGTALVDQIISTAFFLIIICAVIDERNMQLHKGLIPIAIGFVNLGVMQFSFGYNCGASLNPARDLAPRILSQISGWNGVAFGHEKHSYFWVPVIASHIGAVLGCWIYRLMIENHWPNDSYEFRHQDEHEMTRNQCHGNTKQSYSIHVTESE